IPPLTGRRLLEVGCGAGADLLMFLRLGFEPGSLVGNELRVERAELARTRLPEVTTILTGDACHLELPVSSFDVVYQSTVFSSILDSNWQQALAKRMWSLVRPGGGVLWYDFTFDNPRNADVRGIRVSRIRELYPEGELYATR